MLINNPYVDVLKCKNDEERSVFWHEQYCAWKKLSDDWKSVFYTKQKELERLQKQVEILKLKIEYFKSFMEQDNDAELAKWYGLLQDEQLKNMELEDKVKNQKVEIKNLCKSLELERDYRKIEMEKHRNYKKKTAEHIKKLHPRARWMTEEEANDPMQVTPPSEAIDVIEVDCRECSGTGEFKFHKFTSTSAEEVKTTCLSCEGLGKSNEFLNTKLKDLIEITFNVNILGNLTIVTVVKMKESELRRHLYISCIVRLHELYPGSTLIIQEHIDVCVKEVKKLLDKYGLRLKDDDVHDCNDAETVNGVRVNCEKCEGNGRIQFSTDSMRVDGENFHVVATHDCMACNGTGKNSRFLGLPISSIIDDFLIRNVCSGWTIMGFIEKSKSEISDIISHYSSGVLSDNDTFVLNKLKKIERSLNKYGLKLKD